jgi:5-methylcytosine-specific restriction endonuclease McrA
VNVAIPNPLFIERSTQSAKGRKKIRVLQRDGYSCVLCSCPVGLTVDHIIPRCVGGSDRYENLRTLCRPCNEAKGQDDGRLSAMGFRFRVRQPVAVEYERAKRSLAQGRVAA